VHPPAYAHRLVYRSRNAIDWHMNSRATAGAKGMHRRGERSNCAGYNLRQDRRTRDKQRIVRRQLQITRVILAHLNVHTPTYTSTNNTYSQHSRRHKERETSGIPWLAGYRIPEFLSASTTKETEKRRKISKPEPHRHANRQQREKAMEQMTHAGARDHRIAEDGQGGLTFQADANRS
jgi:hypothetical protein